MFLVLTAMLASCAIVRTPAQNTGDIGKSDLHRNMTTKFGMQFNSCKSENYPEIYILDINTQYEPKQKVIANVSITKITKLADQNKISTYYVKTAADEIFENQDQMETYYMNNEVLLQTLENEKPMIFSFKEKTLKVLDIKSKKIITLDCTF
jgi:hypothetical protein